MPSTEKQRTAAATNIQRATAAHHRKAAALNLTHTEYQHRLIAHARQKQKEQRAARKAARHALAIASKKKAQTELHRLAQKRANLNQNIPTNLANKQNARNQGYIPMAEALTLFNTTRHQHNKPPYKTANALQPHLIKHNCPRIQVTPTTHYYHAPTIQHIAANHPTRGQHTASRKHTNHRPTATQTELDSGEYLTIRQFSNLTNIPRHTIIHHELAYNFHSLSHPTTGLTLIHSPTAAAHFLQHYKINQTKINQA